MSIFFNLIYSQSINLQDLDPSIRQRIIDSGIPSEQIKEVTDKKGESKNKTSLIDEEKIKSQVRKEVDEYITLDESVNEIDIGEKVEISEDEKIINYKNKNNYLNEGVIEKIKAKKSKTVEEELNQIEIKKIYFGYETFKKDPEIFQPSLLESIDPNYLLGPGDEIIIMLWGETEKNERYSITKDGYLFIPNVGQVFVNSLTLEQLEKKLYKLLKKVYSTLDQSSGEPKTFLDVSLGSTALRPLRVFVMGEVSQPGAYNVRPTTSLFSSLFYFNGPKISGSLRDIRLIRNNKEIATIDFYDYLLKGKQINDNRLQRNDIIFISQRGKTVRTIGEINKQMYFELKPDEGLKELIEIAGNIKSSTYMKRISINRIEPPEVRLVTDRSRTNVDVNLAELINSDKNFELFDGDEITFLRIDDTYGNVVDISGSVKRGGRYELAQGMTLVELIIKADSLLGDTYMQRAEIIRTNKDIDYKRSLINVNLDSALNNHPNHNILLKSNDKVTIYSNSEMFWRTTSVTLAGHVKSPGSHELYRGMTLYDLVMKGGGFSNAGHLKNTYFDRADLAYYDTDGKLIEIIPFRLDSLLNKKGLANEELKMGCRVRIYSYEEVYGMPPNSISIKGHVKRPGIYDYYNDLSIADLLFLAGGFDDEEHLFYTYKNRADIIRVNPDKLTKDILSFDLSNLMRNEESDLNIDLLPGDELIIYDIDNFIEYEKVSISGVINNPGQYDLKNDMTLFDLIIEAGGVNNIHKVFRAEIARYQYSIDKNGEENYIKSIVLNINNGTSIFDNSPSSKNIILEKRDYVIIRPSPPSAYLGLVTIEGLVVYPGVYPIINSDEKVSDIINRAGGLVKRAYPLSSVFTRDNSSIRLSFEKIIKYPKSKYNFTLRDGDVIKINAKPNLVVINGLVNNPGRYQYIKNNNFSDYIEMAGGLTKDASKYGSFVTYPDGTAKRVSLLKLSPRVKDGSVINVIAKEEREPFDVTTYVTNLTQIYADISQSYLLIMLALNSNK